MATPSLIRGRATPEGTARLRDRHSEVLKEHFRIFAGIALSDLGIGTYLGEADEATDQAYTNAVVRSVERGVNVIDSAINYRFQRSERSIGHALRSLIASKKLARDEIFIATKGGFVSFDGNPMRNPMDYFKQVFFDHGIISPEDIVSGCHSMHPNYIRHELDASRSNLGVETIDLYYLHNAETQLEETRHDEFEKRLEAVFTFLEGASEEGKIGCYGLATWDMYRIPATEPHHFSLTRTLEIAQKAGGKNHHFRAVQLPFNLVYLEAALSATQPYSGNTVSFLRVAQELDILVMASVPLFQGRLLGKLPPRLRGYFRDAKTDAQRVLAFAAAAPGIHTVLAGMSKEKHVEENTEYLRQRRMNAAAWRKIVDT